MSIEDKILYILNKGKPLKAREIVELLANEFDLKIEKKK